MNPLGPITPTGMASLLPARRLDARNVPSNSDAGIIGAFRDLVGQERHVASTQGEGSC